MELDLEQIKAAARAAGGGQWTASDGIVWFDDGDSALTVMNPVPAHIAHDNLGTWPDLIEAEDIAKFSALVCPAAVLALVERLERAERISPYAFWFTAAAEFDDLCPAEVLAGACLAQRREAPTPAQRRTLELAPIERCKKIKAYAASSGPDVISSEDR